MTAVSSIFGALRSVLLPLSAPVDSTVNHARTTVWWRMLCGLCLIPATAFMHHMVFMRPTCILNNFGTDYTPTVIMDWLRHDPSLGWAILSVLAVYWLGLSRTWLRALVAPAFLAGLPLSVWIWDVPFSHRIVCQTFHDSRLVLPVLGVIKTTHIYLLGMAILGPLSTGVLLKNLPSILPGFVPAPRRPALAAAANGTARSEMRPSPARPVGPDQF